MNQIIPLPRPEIVRARRKQLDLSYERLAERLSVLCNVDIKWQSIQQFEQGKSVRPRFYRELAAALTTSPEYLAGLTEDPNPNNPFTVPVQDSPRATHRPTGHEERTVIHELYRLFGRLEARIEALEARLDRGPDEPEATTKNPRRGTRGR